MGEIDIPPETLDRERAERRATYVELFLDLVFVFSVTQIASLISTASTLESFGRGLLIAWLVWWLWTQFAWMGTAIDLSAHRRGQASVLFAVPIATVMAVFLPDAFAGGGIPFAVAYCSTQLVGIALLGAYMWSRPNGRAVFLGYASVATIGPLAVAVGGFLDGNARTVCWILAAAFGVIGALLGASSRSDDDGWNVDPSHFSERHALFIIVCLGEILVAVGTSATGLAAEFTPMVGVVSTVSVACVFWWIYFAFIPEVGERALRESPRNDRGRIARDLYSFAHFPIVFGLILYAIVAKHVVQHPTDSLSSFDQRILIGAVICVLGGFLAIHFRFNGGVALERVVGLAVAVASILILNRFIPGAVLVLLVAAILGVMHGVTVARFNGRISRGLYQRPPRG